MVVAKKLSDDPHVHLVTPTPQSVQRSKYATAFYQKELQTAGIDQNRSPLSDTLFSFPYPGMDVSEAPFMQEADVINLHWCNGLLAPSTLTRIANRGIPMVWSLHDMWPFTGGCHYTAGCERFEVDCAGCPQLRRDNYGIPAAVLRDKIASVRPEQLTIVALSRWMYEQAARSRVFSNHRIELIHNGLDTQVYNQSAREDARAALGIEQSAVVLMFGAAHGRSKRKGFDLLATAIKTLARDGVLSRHNVVVLSMGHPSAELQSLPVQVHDVGYQSVDEDIAQVYGASDVFVLPSREDNLPNTVMEAMACGCVPIAFDVGGVGDLFDDGIEGMLISPFDTGEFAGAMKTLIESLELRVRMGKAGSERIQREHTLERQASQYSALFGELANPGAERFGRGMRSRYAVRLDPYPSTSFAGDGGMFYRRILFSSYSPQGALVAQTPSKTLFFLLLRRCIRKASQVPMIGPALSRVTGFVRNSAVYRRIRERLATGVGASD